MVTPKPLYVIYDVTLACNASCIHCYSHAGKPLPNELTTEEGHKLIDEVADAGTILLGFGGGEALIRKDCFEFMQHAHDRKMITNVATNGILINRKSARQLKEVGIHAVTVSIDSTKPDLHDYIRQVPNLFKQACDAIKYLKNEGVKVLLGFTPMSHNYKEREEIVKLAIELDADTVNVSEYVPTGRVGTNIALTSDQLMETMSEWVRLEKKYEHTMRITWHDCRASILIPEIGQTSKTGCGAGRTTCRIAADGTLYSCPLLPVPCGNVREKGFLSLWETAPLMINLRDRSNLKNNCGCCDKKEVCGGCRAVAYANYGDVFEGDSECWYKPLQYTPSKVSNSALIKIDPLKNNFKVV
jgi:AdoMet-dependent heme synthase